MPRSVNARGEVRQAGMVTVRAGRRGAGNLWVHLRIKSDLNSGPENRCWLLSWLTHRIVNAHRAANCARVANVRVRRHSAEKLWVHLSINSELDSSTNR